MAFPLSLFACSLALLLLSGCTSTRVEAGGYTDTALSGIGVLRLPAQFVPVAAATPSGALPGITLLGQAPEPIEDHNFWAVTHAFAFRPQAPRQPALLLVSRVADAQSFAAAQLYYERGLRFATDARWIRAQRPAWKSQTLGRGATLFSAELAPGEDGADVYVYVHRDSLIEAMLIGERKVLNAAAALAVLSALPEGYRLTTPLEDYFRSVSKVLQTQSEQRRKQYLSLLETLQKEELDYTPTPRVVVFNSNLAGQFFWPAFDRSGVPLYFAIAGRLGIVRKKDPEAWKQLEGSFPGMRLVAAEAASDAWRPLAGPQPLPARTLSLLADTGWAQENRESGSSLAFATLQFSFTGGAPNLSDWLNSLEAAGRQAEALGLITLPRPL
jgi:hypothetical protein